MFSQNSFLLDRVGKDGDPCQVFTAICGFVKEILPPLTVMMEKAILGQTVFFFFFKHVALPSGVFWFCVTLGKTKFVPSLPVR